MKARSFFDTNIPLYLFSEDEAKAEQAEQLLKAGGVISVQVLNELTSVARRKLGMTWEEVNEVLVTVKRACSVLPLTLRIHEVGVALAEQYSLSVYDAMIVATALEAEAEYLYTEDMQHGFVVADRLTLVNPFLHES